MVACKGTGKSVKRVVIALALALGGAVLSTCGSPNVPTPIPPPDRLGLTCPGNASAMSSDGSPVPVMYGDPVISGGKAPFTLTCSPVSGALFSVGSTSVTCTVTDASKLSANCPLTVTVAIPVVPTLTATRFVAFGDSMTAGEDGQDVTSSTAGKPHPEVLFPDFQTYPGVLQSLLDARYTKQTSPRVINAGKGGEEVAAPGTLGRFADVLAGGTYDVVLIMEGANDLMHEDATLEPAVISGLRQMIVSAKQKNLQVYLATIPPENPAGCCPIDRGRPSALVPDLNAQIRNLSDEQHVPLVDVYNDLSSDVNTYIGPDGLHPTARGYAKIADTFFQKIQLTLEASSNAARPGRVSPRAGSSGRVRALQPASTVR
jgi:lysophospholipase L1-like esterase